MVEIRRGSDAYGTVGGERLPWLEPVEDEDGADYGSGGDGGGYGGVLLAAIGVLIGIAAITAAVVWWRHHLAATADLGQIIHAPQGPYKVRPADPGGMKPDKNGEVAYGTSTGQDIDSPLDLSAMPEQPIERAKPAQPAPAPAPTPAAPASKPASSQAPATMPAAPVAKPAAVPLPAIVKPAPAKPIEAEPERAEAVPAGAAGTIQLGAFSSQAKALSVWKTMSARFSYLKPLEQAVVPVESDGKTLYRLRASGPGAAGACARLRIAGETCSSVG